MAVAQVNAIFRQDRLVTVTFYSTLDPNEARSRLVPRYGEPLVQLGRALFLVNSKAERDELTSVGVGPPHIPGARSSVTYVTKEGVDHPWLDGP